MKEAANPGSGGGKTQRQTSQQNHIERLESLLQKHLRLAGDGDFQAMLKDADQVDNLLRLASESAPGSSDASGEQLKRVTNLHRKIHLLIKTEKDQMQSTLAKVRRGKRAMRKYQGSGARLG